MKQIYLLLATIVLLLIHKASFSQAICGFDGVHRHRLQSDTDLRQKLKTDESSIRQYIQQNPRLGHSKPIITNKVPGGGPVTLSGPPYTIPVVVHVIHTGGAIGSLYNPTDQQIQGAIDYLNAVYNGTYPGLNAAGAGDLQIQFVLAKRDPNCNPTTGIDRVDGSGVANYVSGGVKQPGGTSGAPELTIKNLDRWDPSRYYNIWIVNKIDGFDGTSGQFIAGYAYFPGSPSDDGTVMLATQMIAGQKTLPHEIGHAFNLYHPFEGSSDVNTCPPHPNNDCSLDGDEVCDTDPISENISGGVVNFTCRTGTNTCTGTAYNDLTESNFMNYTNCYTLFTPGQKTRMLAAASVLRTSLINSTGGTAPNAGPSPCIPKINFEISSDQAREATTAITGCRAYKDYTYNLTIGSPPTATATVAISVNSGGTAKQGDDFDITTNGSFTSPSQALTFPSGSTTSRSVTIRVYDDARINGSRSFVLSFTVNNGGGDAVLGDANPTFSFTINDNDAPPVPVNTTGTANLGTATLITGNAPLNAKLSSQRTQFLYKASELTNAGMPAGNITGFSLRIQAKNSIRAFTNLNIKLGVTTADYLLDGAASQGTGMTVVKTLASYNTVAGWNNFTFDAPYVWDGTSNLVVEICYDNTTAAAGDGMDIVYYYSDGGAPNQASTFHQDGATCSTPISFGSVTFIGGGAKPQARFTYGVAATVVESLLNSSIQQYLGPNADVYFYDQTNGQLMARIQNLSNFDYGCTQVVIDRVGTASKPFWNNNTSNYLMDKTFRVIPTTNNPAGSYNITLYFTQAETDGWHTATSQPLNNIQLIKVAGKISDVTPANPTGGGAVVIGTPTVSAMGTNTALTYGFSTGFSGFGAGIPDVALPVSMLDFEGELRNGKVALQWITSIEQNAKGFIVERSYDGVTFDSIGFVNASGNSSTPHTYTFIDTAAAHSKNFYRLKEVDLDSRFSYSDIIQVDDTRRINPFVASPSPFTTGLDLTFAQTPAGRLDIRLMDMTGRQLLRKVSPPQQNIHLDLDGLSLPAGIYLLVVRTGSKTYTQKLIK